MIDDVEFHETVMPDGLSWEKATPHLALLVMWAYRNNLFSDELNGDKNFVEKCKELDRDEIKIPDFVADYLDGVIIEGYFTSEVASFLSDYVSLGIYFGDLEKFFSVKSIYSLPNKIAELNPFYNVLDVRFSHHKSTGELPAYRTLVIGDSGEVG